ncbi:MAG: HAMP domain-containing histidine kinase [Desulfovibrio sp.]|nr:HAMP domain-containing histidine kinase [Desulfovibrio sp.]
MTHPVPETLFAPADRSTEAELNRQHSAIVSQNIPTILDALPISVMVLNGNRQVVFGNRLFLEAVGARTVREMIGKRPGEAFGCIHSCLTSGGCGTSEFCAECGAVRSVLRGLKGEWNVMECNITREMGASSLGSMDLRVCSAPIFVDGERFVVFSITDISHEKRRRILERIFFHDILNTLGGIKGLMEFFKEEVPQPLREDAELIHGAVNVLAEEIASQKQLLAAESNELEINIIDLNSMEILEILQRTFRNAEEARDKVVDIDPDSVALEFRSDYTLLKRVLGNMVKNALEATKPEGRVTLGVRTEGDDSLRFWVRNAGEIPRKIQLHLFNRSFSTKGAGRGLGTYSIKLLTERYLGGEVGFTTSTLDGTEFFVRLPVRGPR